MYNDDDFNWNHGISLAQTGNFKVCCAHHKLAARAARRKLNWRRARAQAAEEALLLVQNERYKSEYCYISWLAR